MKLSLYPKTERIGTEQVIITEKLDGSNLGIFKLNGEVYFAQRNYVFKYDELTKENSYKGLRGWMEENTDSLNKLNEGSCVFGEWIGTGQIGYGGNLDKRFYIFAKANVRDGFDVSKINYDYNLFKYPFEGQEIPECIGVVPLVEELSLSPSISYLDTLYEQYIKKVDRGCEGFVVNSMGGIKKYVRMKNGKPSAHKGYTK